MFVEDEELEIIVNYNILARHLIQGFRLSKNMK